MKFSEHNAKKELATITNNASFESACRLQKVANHFFATFSDARGPHL